MNRVAVRALVCVLFAVPEAARAQESERNYSVQPYWRGGVLFWAIANFQDRPLKVEFSAVEPRHGRWNPPPVQTFEVEPHGIAHVDMIAASSRFLFGLNASFGGKRAYQMVGLYHRPLRRPTTTGERMVSVHRGWGSGELELWCEQDGPSAHAGGTVALRLSVRQGWGVIRLLRGKAETKPGGLLHVEEVSSDTLPVFRSEGEFLIDTTRPLADGKPLTVLLRFKAPKVSRATMYRIEGTMQGTGTEDSFARGVIVAPPQGKPLPPVSKRSAERADYFSQPRDPEPLPGALVQFDPSRGVHGASGGVLAFSPDGKTLACGSYHGNFCLWSLDGSNEVRRFGQHQVPARAVAVSPDGRVIASGSLDGQVALWELAGRRARGYLPGRHGHVSALAFSADGRTLAWGSSDRRTVRLWDVAGGKDLGAVGEVSGGVLAVAFSAKGNLLAVGTADGSVGVWDPVRRKEVRRFKGDRAGIHGLAFSPDGRRLATASCDGRVVLLDLGGGRPRAFGKPGQAGTLVAFAPDGRTLAAAGSDRSVRMWRIADGAEVRRLDVGASPVTALAFACGGKALVAADLKPAIHVWDAATGQKRYEWPWAFPGAVAVAAGGATLAWTNPGGWVECRDLATGADLGPCRGHPEGVVALQFTRDGKRLLSVGAEGTLRWWDAADGRELKRFGKPRGDIYDDRSVWSAAFNANATRVALGCWPGNVRFWETATGKELGHWKGESRWVAALSRDGKRLATTGLTLWDPVSGKKLAALASPEISVEQVAFAPEGDWLVGVGWKKDLVLWQLGARSPPRRLASDVGYGVALSPDGRTVAAGDWQGRIRLWEVWTGRERLALGSDFGMYATRDKFPTRLTFSPDGRRLVSDMGSQVVLWDATGLERARDLGPEVWWLELGSTDAARAYAAVWGLAEAPKTTVAFLKGRLRPVEVASPAEIDRLIADLGHKRFQVRDRAMQRLRRLGDAPEAALRKALTAGLELEAIRRLETLLRPINDPLQSAEPLRAGRAVEVLELIGTPEARQVLQSLAKGAEDAALTREARASLRRLARRAASAGGGKD
jgi:WD40 repeat protein